MRKVFAFALVCYLLFQAAAPYLTAQEAELQKAEELNARVAQLYQQGQYDQALPLAQEALRLREQAFGPEHPYVATSLHNLAEIYRSTGAYNKAEPLLQRALKINEANLGPDHPDVAESLNNLALLYKVMGTYSKAETLYQRALNILESHLGPDHPSVATSLNNLALLYHTMGAYGQAKPLFQRALKIREAKLGPDHPDVAISLNNLAAFYQTTGEYVKAESLFKQSLKIYETKLGLNHPDVATSLNNLAELYRELGLYSQAEPLYKRANKIQEVKLGLDHPNLAICLNNLALLYFNMDSYGQAKPLYQRALKIWESKLGRNHPNVAAGLDNLAELYRVMGSYSQAETIYQRALKIRKEKLGIDHPDVATSLDNLADLYRALGVFRQAESLYQKSLKIREIKIGLEHPFIATSLNNLGGLYQDMGLYFQAESLYQVALKIYEAKLSPDHPNVATSLNNLAVLYKATGAYSKAEPLYQRALKIQEAKLGQDNPYVANSLNNLAELYRDMGSYRQAEPLYQRALKIVETKLDPNHPNVSVILNNLALLFQAIGEYRQAEQSYQRALKIAETKFGSNHPNVATSINNLALLYQDMGAYSQAEPLYKQALKILEVQLGPDHPDVATNLNNLAVLYYNTGEFRKTEALNNRALKIRESKLGPDHPDVAQSLNNLLYLRGYLGNIEQITQVAQRLMQLNFNTYHTVLPYLSEKRQLDYIQRNSPLSPLWPSLCVKFGRQTTDIITLAAELLLNQKGISYEILSNRIRFQNQGRTTLTDSLNQIRTQLANAYFTEAAAMKNPEQYIQNLKWLENQQERLESQLARQGYESEIQKVPVKSVQLCQALPEDYTLVDFWYFHRYNFNGEKKDWSTWQYLAVVYHKNQTPAIVPLGEADSLHKSIGEFLKSIFAVKLEPTRTKEQYLKVEASVKAKGQQLYRQLFQPLLAVIGDKKKLIICADGALHYLPFGVLVDEQNHYLVESYQFHYVSTAREVLKWQRGPRSALRDAVIIADPQFDTALADVGTNEGDIITDRSREWRQMSFAALKHTGPEAIAIDSLLRQNKIATKLYLKGQAQESVLKAVHSPQILHLSTHGFFLPAPKPVNPPGSAGPTSFASPVHQGLVENPLVRCGLALAGANHAESIPGSDDGLATALELAGLDLSGTDLVTLSACQTGIGDLKNGEGLYGLHRAFLLAGAKTVLASLWSVPDLQTRDLMIEFYRRYLSDSNTSKTEAMRQAQLAVIKSLREKYGVAPPAYWGAFVCIGEM